MQIKLLNLTLTNFKGLKSYHLDPRGADTTIVGMNGTGKSTLFDAFTWLLFGKDSHGATKFWVKPRDAAGKEIEGAEPIVEADLDIDGQHVELRRELKENWVQHRGELERERKSDVTKLFIDGVPKKVNEYQAYIDGLISEDLFKLLTVPGAFNALPVAMQRDILMNMFPEVSDAEVIASNDQLAGLKDILNGKSVDDTRKVIANQRRELKKNVDGIPARIDEAERAKQQPQATKPQLLEMQTTYKQSIADLESQIRLAKSTDGDAQRLQEIADLKVKQSETKIKYNDGLEMQFGSLRNEVEDCQRTVSALRHNRDDLQSSAIQAQSQLEIATSKHDQLLDQYHKENAVIFSDADAVCPTCHRELPADEVDEIRKSFNTKHSEKLKSLIDTGTLAAADMKTAQVSLNNSQLQLAQVVDQLAGAEQKLSEKQAELQTKREHAPEFEATIEYKRSQESIAKLEAAHTGSDEKVLSDLYHQLDKQTVNLKMVEADLAKFAQIEAQDARIAQLKQDEAKFKATAQQLEGQDYLLQQFTRAKSGLIEAKLNQLFQVVKFQLFDTQKDGTVVDTVRTTVDGIDYDSGLNTGARMRAGLDIINALDRKHGVLAPIFIDNAEGLTNVFSTDAQQIRLKVTDDEYLKVEE